MKEQITINVFFQAPSGKLIRLGSLAPGRSVNIGGYDWKVVKQQPGSSRGRNDSTLLKSDTGSAGRPRMVLLPADTKVEE